MATVATVRILDRRWRVVRLSLALLGLLQGGTALLALLAPRTFFDDFPVRGAHWVSAFAPYNEHLVRDYGSSFLAISMLALAAAWLAERRLVLIALVVWVLAAGPHLIFHLAHADQPHGAQGVASLVTLTLNVVVALVLLPLVPKETRPS